MHSVEIARHILTTCARPSDQTALLSSTHLKTANVIELGAGTGTLSVLLSPLVTTWTATDIFPLLALISKNVKRNAEYLSSTSTSARQVTANVMIQELDWMWSSKQTLRAFPPSSREEDPTATSYDLLLAADCLFNEALVRPFVNVLNTIDAKVVVVVCELRSEDVLRLFLEEWLASGDWEVWRACKDSKECGKEVPLLESKLVVWVGWRRS